MKEKVYLLTALDKALAFWEDRCFVLHSDGRIAKALGETPAYPLNGQIANWYRLRQLLLTGNPETPLDPELQGPDQQSFNAHVKMLGPTSSLPTTLYMWTSSSRRVYCPDGDLQDLLAHTTLKGVRWSDVRFPFTSFAILLDHPIVDHHGTEFDCIVADTTYCSTKDRWDINIRLFPRHLREYVPIPDHVKRRVQEYLTHRQYQKAAKLLAPHVTLRQKFMTSYFCLYCNNVENELVTDDVVPMINRQFEGMTMVGDPRPHWNTAVRLVVGMCLYLESLGTNGRSTHVGPVEPPIRSGEPDPNAITHGAYVCAVSCMHTLSDEEREMIRGAASGREMSAHFRMAHWRRAPGFGNDPDAPRTIWVRWSFVRQDRLRPGQLPGGAITRLQSPPEA